MNSNSNTAFLIPDPITGTEEVTVSAKTDVTVHPPLWFPQYYLLVEDPLLSMQSLLLLLWLQVDHTTLFDENSSKVSGAGSNPAPAQSCLHRHQKWWVAP